LKVGTRQIRFRIILPLVYIVVSGVLVGNCLLHLGHSVWCQYFLDSMFPWEMIATHFSQSILIWRTRSLGPGLSGIVDDSIRVILPLVLTLAQYYLIGRLIDRLLDKRSFS
jgi:hypothetical protein